MFTEILLVSNVVVWINPISNWQNL